MELISREATIELLKQMRKDGNMVPWEGKDVFADQTSLTPKARKWFLSHVHGYDRVNLIWIDEDLDTCLERNEKRKGTRAYVPREVVRRMHFQFVIPSLNEGFNCIFRYNSKENKITYQGEFR